jgi:hypothetical protein
MYVRRNDMNSQLVKQNLQHKRENMALEVT